MGLGAPKKRDKLSYDPNNTAWSKSTENYGHKILASQGWKPGEYLGAKDAGHSDHYTAANASHIRVLLREDNLGLGGQLGKSKAETFGLSTLSGIFGRLNGKSDADVQKQQDAQRDVELRTYQVQKYGFVNFVSGGLLVGDKIEPRMTQTTIGGRTLEASDKKRKAEDQEPIAATSAELMMKRKSKLKLGTATVPLSVQADGPTAQKSKKRSRDVTLLADRSGSTIPGDSKVQTAMAKPPYDFDNRGFDSTRDRRQKDHKAKRVGRERVETSAIELEIARPKLKKRERKEERRKRKEEKQCLGLERFGQLTAGETSSARPSEPEGCVSVEQPQAEQVPNQLVACTGNRHAVRQRYIQQKRLASMNPGALREIFMLKATA